MPESHEIWSEQCDAARDIREVFGLQKALGYLIGGKLLNVLRASDQDSAFASELPRFVEEIKQIFDRAESRPISQRSSRRRARPCHERRGL